MHLSQESSFSCSGLVMGGYYADTEQDCQAYHVCLQVNLLNTSLFSMHKGNKTNLTSPCWPCRTPTRPSTPSPSSAPTAPCSTSRSSSATGGEGILKS